MLLIFFQDFFGWPGGGYLLFANCSTVLGQNVGGGENCV